MKVIRVGDRVVIREPGQPVRYGTVTNIESFNNHLADIITDDGVRLLACPQKFLTLEGS